MMIYFRGCLTRDRLPKIEDATKKLLTDAGIDYQILDDEDCCGSVLLRTGYHDDALLVMNETVEKLRGKKVLVSCAGCYHTLKKDYQEILGENLDIIHTSQLMEKLIKEGKIEVDKDSRKVTYHDPCHLGRHMGEYQAPRNVIKSTSNLIEMDRNREKSRCCGAGGGVKSSQPEKSLTMARKRLEDALETGSDYIVTCCPFCLVNLEEAGDMVVKDLTQHIMEGHS